MGYLSAAGGDGRGVPARSVGVVKPKAVVAGSGDREAEPVLGRSPEVVPQPRGVFHEVPQGTRAALAVRVTSDRRCKRPVLDHRDAAVVELGDPALQQVRGGCELCRVNRSDVDPCGVGDHRLAVGVTQDKRREGLTHDRTVRRTRARRRGRW